MNENSIVESNHVVFVGYKGVLKLAREIRNMPDGLRLIRRHKGHWFIQADTSNLGAVSLAEVSVSRFIEHEQLYYSLDHNPQIIFSRRRGTGIDIKQYKSLESMLRWRVE